MGLAGRFSYPRDTPGVSMAGYRLYLVSDLTGRFEPAKEFDAKSDRAAIAIAEEARSNRPAELWHGSRLVTGWKPRSPQGGLT